MQVVKTYPGVGNAAWLDLVREEPGRYSIYPIGFYKPLASGFITCADAEIFVTDLQNQQREQMRAHEALARMMEQPIP